tara:strand:- start:89 stop:484 length:396 start_codon:yes stop_codon:yes gene_type:complete
MGDQYNPSGRFGGDMDRNEVEIDLNKFMALLQEKSELKDRIRELEDEHNRNPYQKIIFVAEAIDSWRIIPRAFLAVYMYLLYYTTFWFMGLADPTMQQSGLISVVVGAGAAWFGLYTNSKSSKGDFTKGDK